MANFMKALEKNEKKLTENGAVGFATSGHKIVDLNFAIPSFRSKVDTSLFEQAFNEDRNLTLKWLLYLRDIRGGVGERKSFRDFMVYLSKAHEDVAVKLINEVDIAEYGRWDDLIDICFRTKSNRVKLAIRNVIVNQFIKDMKDCAEGKNISLLSKWMPSISASSKKTIRQANIMKLWFGFNSRQYRKVLSKLRNYIDVVERKMSANEWNKIDYSAVPSKANLNYGFAFMKHDEKRRTEYLESLKHGETKINAQAMFLHDIVHKYDILNTHYGISNVDINDTLEALWDAQDKVEGFKNTLVVRDGSGSMTDTIGNSSVTALDVASAISLYCAQNNSGEFKNKFITFSSHPQMVTVNSDTLFENLNIMRKYNDCSNTNIEATFDLILDTAVKNHMSQEDMPKTVLIITDCEFDRMASGSFFWGERTPTVNKALFEVIRERFEAKGYKLPKLVFWNVGSRTNTIPLTENEMGVILLSGFSKNLMQMVMSSELDPYKALVRQLNVPRYSVIDKVFD